MYFSGSNFCTFRGKSTKTFGGRKTRSLLPCIFLFSSDSNSFFPQTPLSSQFLLLFYPLSIFNYQLINIIIYSTVYTFDYSFRNKGFFYLTTFFYAHENREDSLWCSWMQATAIIREYFWKHWDDSTWHIDTCPTKVCLSIEMSSPAHIFCDISNMDTEKKIAILILSKRDGIIEILRICTIDCHRRPTSKIKSLLSIYFYSWKKCLVRNFDTIGDCTLSRESIIKR